MRWRWISLAITAGFLAATAQSLAAVESVAAGIVASLAIGLVAPWVFRRLTGPVRWIIPLWSAAVSLTGVAGAVVVSTETVPAWFVAPVIAGAATAGWLLFVRSGTAPLCAICRQRLSEVSFTCPRCGWRICDRNECWSFYRARCQRCLENGVKLLTGDPAWWQKTFGSPSPRGRCQVCLETGSATTNVFGCPRCGSLQCGNCWDEVNGQCKHCGWTIPDLPERVRNYLFTSKE